MEETIRSIKKEFRANMNGIASAEMRKAGMPYHVVWGIELPRLRDIAAEFRPDRRLGQRLWNEDVRESQLIGILLTPREEFLPEVADIWVNEARTQESVSLIAMELVSPQAWASEMAFRWIASGKSLSALCGWLTICHLLRRGAKLMPRSEAELRDHAAAISDKAPIWLRKAANQALTWLEEESDKILHDKRYTDTQ